MKYDKEIQTQYGFIHGSKTLVFIKTGRGGSIYGYQDKYVRISHAINDRFGYSVCVSANPPERESDLSEEIAFINQQQQLDDIYFIGVSNGALVGAQQGYRESRIKGMLLINGPLMINWYKTRKGIEAFCGKGYVCFMGNATRLSAILNCWILYVRMFYIMLFVKARIIILPEKKIILTER